MIEVHRIPQAFASFTFFLFLLVATIGCSTVEPRSFVSTYPSEAMGKPMAYSVYTPPNWSASETLPLVVMLHGGGGDHLDFDRYDVDLYLDELYRDSNLPRAVIALPDGEVGFWENWADGSRSYRDWVVDEMMVEVEKAFPTIGCPDNCHVMGVSMGGHGALRLGYLEADTFASVTAISAPILNHEQTEETFGGFMGLLIPTKRIWGAIDDSDRKHNPYVSWTEDAALRQKSLFLSWGTQDHKTIIRNNEAFSAHLAQSDLPFHAGTYEGGHKWIYWKKVIAQALAYHMGDQG